MSRGLCERAGHPDPGGQGVSSAPEGAANLAGIDTAILRSHGNPDISSAEFFEENGNDDAPDGANEIDHPLGVIIDETELDLGGFPQVHQTSL